MYFCTYKEKLSRNCIFLNYCCILERNSSIEIYRIIATFAVLVYHFNGWLVGGVPKYFDIDRISSFRITQALIESSSCICVNMFIVISGYFGLRLKWQSVLKICFLLLSVHIPFYMFDCLFFDATFVMKEFVRKFLIVSNGGYFIQCYLMLMFLSPLSILLLRKQIGERDCFLLLCLWGLNFGLIVLLILIILASSMVIPLCISLLSI